jgi:hypothetical protein
VNRIARQSMIQFVFGHVEQQALLQTELLDILVLMLYDHMQQLAVMK